MSLKYFQINFDAPNAPLGRCNRLHDEIFSVKLKHDGMIYDSLETETRSGEAPKYLTKTKLVHHCAGAAETAS